MWNVWTAPSQIVRQFFNDGSIKPLSPKGKRRLFTLIKICLVYILTISLLFKWIFLCVNIFFFLGGGGGGQGGVHGGVVYSVIICQFSILVQIPVYSVKLGGKKSMMLILNMSILCYLFLENIIFEIRFCICFKLLLL